MLQVVEVPDTAVQHVLDESGLYLNSSTISIQSSALHLQNDPLISLQPSRMVFVRADSASVLFCRWWGSRTRQCSTCWTSSGCT